MHHKVVHFSLYAECLLQRKWKTEEILSSAKMTRKGMALIKLSNNISFS